MSEKKTERRGLGRGLSALMGDVRISEGLESYNPESQPRDGLRLVPTEALRPNPNQPRQTFNDSSIAELAASIREKGIVQPLIVRPLSGETQLFEIVAGERRWRAAQEAQVDNVPVIVRAFDDQEVLEIAIIENIQREGLNAIDEGNGYRQLIEKFGHTQERVATALGKSRSHIANQMRLLALPEEVQNMIRANTLTAGHARALITAGDPLALALKVVGRGLSVRETEKLAREIGPGQSQRKRTHSAKDPDTEALERDLSAHLGMSVTISHKAAGEGQVSIRYASIDQLDLLCQLLSTMR